MICFHPKEVKVQKKVSWNHYVDRYIRVPCGKCLACRRRRQQDWSFRIQSEADDCIKSGGSVYFVTMTLSPENLSYLSDPDTGEVSSHPTLDTLMIGRFMRSLRKQLGVKSVRYFGCGEYGDHVTDNLRPHYHVILFLKDKISAEDLRPFVDRSWNKGLVLGIHPLSSKLAEYVAKYSLKRVGFDYSDRVPPFARMSLKPAIGSGYLSSEVCQRYKAQEALSVYDSSGCCFALPRYYRDRMYSREFLESQNLAWERLRLTLDEVSIRKNPHCLMDRYKANVRYEENFIKKISLVC